MRRLSLFTLVLVGIACGIVAVGFHQAVELARRALIEHAVSRTSLPLRVVLTLAVPTLIFVALAWLIRRFAPDAGGANLARARRAYETDPAVLDDRSIVAVALLTPISLGAGAPLGPEGPTVVISSGVAMWIARAMKMPRRLIRGMIPVGTAAGIAAIFNTPITGVVFAMEEVMGSASRGVLGGTIIAAVAAAVVERIALGGHPLLSASGTWTDVRELAGFVVIGVTAGLVSGGAIRAAIAARRAIAGIPLLARAAMGGLAVGTIGIFVPDILGVGYSVTSQFLHGGGTLRVAAAAFAAKTIGLVAALACGVIGGTFAPSLFIGAALGSAVGHAAKFVLPMPIDPGAFALVGMGAFFAGFLRCPISAVLIVVEVTGDYNLVLPLMLGVATSTAISRRIARHSLTEVQMADEGFVERISADDPLAGLRVAQVMSRDVALLTADMTMAQAASRVVASVHRVYPVVNENNRLLGTIARSSIAGSEEPLAPHIDPVRFSARADDDLLETIHAMAKAGVDRCVVVDGEERVVGFLSPSDILRARMRVGGAVDS